MIDAKDVIEGLAIAHAQGFAAGQRDMQARAAEVSQSIYCDGDWLDRDHAANAVASAIAALPIKDQP